MDNNGNSMEISGNDIPMDISPNEISPLEMEVSGNQISPFQLEVSAKDGVDDYFHFKPSDAFRPSSESDANSPEPNSNCSSPPYFNGFGKNHQHLHILKYNFSKHLVSLPYRVNFLYKS